MFWRVESLHNDVMKRLHASEKVTGCLGSPMKSHGDPGRRGKGTQVTRHFVTEAGVEKMKMAFYVVGPTGRKGVVHVEQRKDENGEWDFYTLHVDVQGFTRMYVIDKREVPLKVKKSWAWGRVAEAIIIGPTPFTLNITDSDGDAVLEVQDPPFGFLKGGSMDVSVTDIQYSSDVGIEPASAASSSWLFVCRDSVVPINSIASNNSVNLDVCSRYTDGIKKPDTNCIFFQSFHDLTNQSTKTSFEVTLILPDADVYNSFAILCNVRNSSTNVSASGVLLATFTNPGPSYTRHLNSAQIPALYCYVGFSCLWTVALICWLANRLTFPTMKNQLHTCMTFVPLSFLMNDALTALIYVSLGLQGTQPTALNTLKFFVITFYVVTLYTTLMLMAKGWYVVRLRLSPVEKRTIGGNAIFVALGYIFFLSIQSGAVLKHDYSQIALTIFMITSYVYMYWCLRTNMDALRGYIDTLKVRLPDLPASATGERPSSVSGLSVRERPEAGVSPGGAVATASMFRLAKRVVTAFRPPAAPEGLVEFSSLGADWNLVYAYEQKLWMMRMTHRIITYFSLTSFLMLALTFFNAFAYTSGQVAVEQSFLLVGFFWMALTYRLRDPAQKVVVPMWTSADRCCDAKAAESVLIMDS
ncbi:hypothetical protein HK101_001932 [Irineochytrium annulatum]|nr:hypothetical protein HK101_001932 [Irineochytrium annulatum]